MTHIYDNVTVKPFTLHGNSHTNLKTTKSVCLLWKKKSWVYSMQVLKAMQDPWLQVPQTGAWSLLKLDANITAEPGAGDRGLGLTEPPSAFIYYFFLAPLLGPAHSISKTCLSELDFLLELSHCIRQCIIWTWCFYSFVNLSFDSLNCRTPWRKPSREKILIFPPDIECEKGERLGQSSITAWEVNLALSWFQACGLQNYEIDNLVM